MRKLLAVSLVLLAGPAAAAALAPISPHLAHAYLGQCVRIAGTASVRNDPQRPGFDLDLDGKDSPALGYILPQNQAQFPDLASLEGRRITVTGVPHLYLGRAEILLTSASQVSPGGGDEDNQGLTHIGPEFQRGSSTLCG